MTSKIIYFTSMAFSIAAVVLATWAFFWTDDLNARQNSMILSLSLVCVSLALGKKSVSKNKE